MWVRVNTISVFKDPKRSERKLELLEIGGRMESIKTTALLRSARILRRVLETRRDLLSLRFL